MSNQGAEVKRRLDKMAKRANAPRVAGGKTARAASAAMGGSYFAACTIATPAQLGKGVDWTSPAV